MQANEFEKQVQQKMEELDFTPSSPVWIQIEKRIRKKNDRRKMFFWLPLVAILLAGGIWFVNQSENKNIAVVKHEDHNIQKKSPVLPQPQKRDDAEIENEVTKKQKLHASKNNSFDLNKYSKPNETRIQSQPVKKETAHKESTNRKNILESISTPGNNDVQHKLNVTTVDSDQPLKTNSQPDTVDVFSTGSTLKNTRVNAIEPDVTPDSLKIKDSLEKNLSIKDSTSFFDSTRSDKNKKQKVVPKWTANLTVYSGSSQLGEGFNFGGAKSFNSYGSPAIGGTPSHPVSKPKVGFSFSLGLLAKKKLSQQTAFITGLQYNYYSTHLNVGPKQRVNVVSSGNFITAARIDDYYSDSLTNNKFTNGYHFISIPLGLSIQLFKKFPLHFQTSFSIQQLITTNSLINKNDIYFHDKKAFTKTKLFSDVGLLFRFSVSKKVNILAGPEVQYSWSRLQRDDSPYQHLLSAGLRAIIEFPEIKK